VISRHFVSAATSKKFCTSEVRARLSLNIRRFRSSTAGSCSFLRMAESSSSSSGMLLQRKNDKRAASSTSEGCTPFPARRWPDRFDPEQKIGAHEHTPTVRECRRRSLVQ
jgi:hypothetical protein